MKISILLLFFITLLFSCSRSQVNKTDNFKKKNRSDSIGPSVIEGIEYKAYLPDNFYISNEKAKIAIFLHGDGGELYTKEQYSSFLDFAKISNIILIAALTPHENLCWWAEDIKSSANLVFASFLSQLIKKYNADPEQIFFIGVSGGSSFLSEEFFPFFGKEFPGHYLLICGGDDPYYGKYEFDLKNEEKRKYSFYFIYGSNDDLIDYINEGITFYSENGFATNNIVIFGKGHCDFDYYSRIETIIKSILTQVYHQQLSKCNNIIQLAYFRQVYGALQILHHHFFAF